MTNGGPPRRRCRTATVVLAFNLPQRPCQTRHIVRKLATVHAGPERSRIAGHGALARCIDRGTFRAGKTTFYSNRDRPRGRRSARCSAFYLPPWKRSQALPLTDRVEQDRRFHRLGTVIALDIRDHITQQRRPFVRFFAYDEDLSHERSVALR